MICLDNVTIGGGVLIAVVVNTNEPEVRGKVQIVLIRTGPYVP